MKSSMRLPTFALLIALLFSGGCLLQSQGNLQTLILYFKLTATVPQSAEFVAHTSTYPNEVKLKGQFVRISGRLDPAPSATRVTVKAVGVDPATGKQQHKFQAIVNVASDGSFSVAKKFNKNIAPGTVQTITVEPVNGDIPIDTEVGICVDITKKKADFNSGNSCATASDTGSGSDSEPNQSGVSVVQVQDNAFSPKSLTIQPGSTVRWELTGSSLNHTVTAMSGDFDSGFVFNAQGAFFERKFPVSEDGSTFEYSCITHKDCCSMQGSVLVGANASPPTDGY